MNAGDFSVQLTPNGDPLMADIIDVFNSVAQKQARLVDELSRVSASVGREGKMRDRVAMAGVGGQWATAVDSVNSLITDLVQPTSEVSRVIKAVAEGDLSQKVELEIEGKQVQGEFFRIGSTVNRMVDQLNAFASEVTRVAREVGTEGVLGGQANVPGVGGTWKDLTDSVNAMASNLTNQVRNIARGDDRGRERRPVAEDHGRSARRSARAEEHDQHDGRSARRRSRRKSRAWRAKSARKECSAARRTCRAWRARGRTSPRT